MFFFFPQPFCAVGSTAKVGFGSIRSAASSTCRIPSQGTFFFVFSEERSFGGVKIKILLGQYKFLE